MTSPLAGSLAKTIGAAMSGLFLPATLSRTTMAEGSEPWTPGAPTTVVYGCRAIHAAWGSSWLAGGLVDADDVKVMVLASSLATEPEPGDVVTIRGESFTVVPGGSGRPAVMTDPAKAVWELRAKR